MIAIQFAPDGDIARALDRRMRGQLADSLRHLIEAGAGDWAPPSGLAAAIETIEGPVPVNPAMFAGYYRATDLLLSGDVAGAAPHLDFLVANAEPATGLSLADPALPSPLGTLFDYYERCFDTDENQRLAIRPAIAPAAKGGLADMEAGLELLQLGAPGVAAEFRALVNQLFLVGKGADESAPHFDGGSSYQLWGALALNVDERRTPIDMAATIAHETAHTFLFGHTIDVPLVLNPDDQLYASPLRPDPRPMDGIYHATFVAARMGYAMDSIARSGAIDGDLRQFARGERRRFASKFRQGLGVVTEHGQLSAPGRTLMQSAVAFIDDMG